jgi:hypothetical protein
MIASAALPRRQCGFAFAFGKEATAKAVARQPAKKDASASATHQKTHTHKTPKEAPERSRQTLHIKKTHKP